MPATAVSPTTNFKSGAATTNAGTITTSTKGAAKVTVTKLQHWTIKTEASISSLTTGKNFFSETYATTSTTALTTRTASE